MRVLGFAFLAALATVAAFAADEPVGRRELRVHDPATPIQDGDGTWWIFSTGKLLLSASSRDLKTWEPHNPVLAAPPAWALEVAPDNKGHHYWAPDILKAGGRYLLYYSVSEFGKNTSAIALATSPELDPAKAGHVWTDRGIVIRSGPGTDFNAIDPSVLADADGRLWMSFGSFFAGLFLVELDPATGLRLAPDSPVTQIAWAAEIEAPTLYHKGDYYYLFFNEGLCCRGKDSTYRVKVGRSRRVTGPYLDDQGKDLREGGGRLVLGSKGDFIGPGHIGLFRARGADWASFHFYDGTHNGAPTLALRRLGWTRDGWPKITD